MREISYRQALNEALNEELVRDQTVFIAGEDVAIYGGAYGVTADLWKKYGDERVKDTPISESAIVGVGLGAALTGMRPVVEIMYIDFIPLALEQINNQAAKIRYMFGGKCTVPLTIRTEGGAGRTLGAHHSQSLESWLIHIPGLKVVMPATPYDAKGLLKSSIRDNNPVVFIEHKMLYNSKGPVPEEEYLIPIGQADIKRQGRDVTVITYSRMVLFS
ncbi:MAG TPA: dehydrogenase, partial [bacterium]|nr:dehydrogenase [bacterium]